MRSRGERGDGVYERPNNFLEFFLFSPIRELTEPDNSLNYVCFFPLRRAPGLPHGTRCPLFLWQRGMAGILGPARNGDLAKCLFQL